MKGYLKLPDKTAQVLNDGWYNTGDLVTVDGNLGIVTVGEPEFELEQADGRPD